MPCTAASCSPRRRSPGDHTRARRKTPSRRFVRSGQHASRALAFFGYMRTTGSLPSRGAERQNTSGGRLLGYAGSRGQGQRRGRDADFPFLATDSSWPRSFVWLRERRSDLPVRCPYQKPIREKSRGPSCVFVVKSAQMGEGDHVTDFGGVDRLVAISPMPKTMLTARPMSAR
jgi:hypothetical protein